MQADGVAIRLTSMAVYKQQLETITSFRAQYTFLQGVQGMVGIHNPCVA